MKFQQWYDKQNEATKAWLDKQAIWHDKDMFISFLIGVCLGIFIGIFL